MKKLFLSAIALVAFSSLGMANAIDIKKNLVEVDENSNRTTPSECDAIRVYYYNHLTSQGVPHDEASGRSYSVYFQCMGRVLSIEP